MNTTTTPILSASKVEQITTTSLLSASKVEQITTTSLLSASKVDQEVYLQLMFSLLTGEIYTIESDELKNMDKYQIPLKCRPKTNCNKCYGRMHRGYNNTIKAYVLCNKCVPKCVDFKKLRSEEIVIDTPKNA